MVCFSGPKGERGLIGEPGKCSTPRSSIQNDFPSTAEYLLRNR